MGVEAALARFREWFRADGAPQAAVHAFEQMYRAYRGGVTGKVAWAQIEAVGVETLVGADAYEASLCREAGEACLDRLVWIVLNGGLGTSMRMDRAKSLVPVKGAYTFLDLIARYVLRRRQGAGAPFPVLFMHSFHTREESLAALAPYGLALGAGRGEGLPLDFVQHRFPRIREADGLPLGDPKDPEAWAPPGHGNLYLALHAGGLLERLLERGIRWAFVSNADNLGAAPHAGILGHLARNGAAFALEVTPRTQADVKGGTLVRRGGRLELLELAQVPEEHGAHFQDPERFPVFNTNNVWVNLEALRDLLRQGGPALPLIVNRKTVGGVGVAQLETAMGAAVGSFGAAAGVLVSRGRFAPVKTTDDLLVRRSDVYREGSASPLEPDPRRDPALGPPLVRLDPRYYGSVADLDVRIPQPLGLLSARSLEVSGDVGFGQGVSVVGDVRLEGPRQIPDHTVLRG
ncbi:MAG: UTP--glucose-1-phosphate uridylyltransferase [Thermodesulfobacteriota bacterium]